MKIVPSILNANLLYLSSDLAKLEEADIEMIHVDIMDGSFVPNISFGPSFVEKIAEETTLKQDVHLMVQDPDQIVDDILEFQPEGITIHYEASSHCFQLLDKIKSHGVKAGIAINPGTSYETVEAAIMIADRVLVMTVNPGFGGQKFIKPMLHKVRKLDLTRQINQYAYQIEVDGGVNDETILACCDAQADEFVVGSYIFNGDPLAQIETLNKKLSEGK
ncbi:ribulose-phosphate 3-epimerase [Xylocopilactobacillus apicola]|uniref:Ribulose-phosphate 3-epimerase n=1 Tax=Xylocopilactobacillus apicola TaxID=2932184 RepID=A0AAU9D0G4_9LACO|nr:ribulose-phosphate 3-epimerase [Xylocopilactobacillus apicola]BDR58161.1 ribulose-phosphate 3-epimerase [Xylocopilactobacillus apicola]